MDAQEYKERFERNDPRDVIIIKIWQKDDIACVLEDNWGITNPTDEMHQKVIDTGYFRALQECHWWEWDVIDEAIVASGIVDGVQRIRLCS